MTRFADILFDSAKTAESLARDRCLTLVEVVEICQAFARLLVVLWAANQAGFQ
jgi:hypothetical protein